MTIPPTEPFGDGRAPNGRFSKGNPGGPGNPYAKRVAALRRALIESVTEEDMRSIVARLVQDARDGDIQAAKEILLRTLGRPTEADLIERLEHLEELFERKEGAEVA